MDCGGSVVYLCLPFHCFGSENALKLLPKQIMSTSFITGNTRISCTEFVCDKRIHNYKCLLIFVLPP